MKKIITFVSALACLVALQAQSITVSDAVGQSPETFVRTHLVDGAGVYVYNVTHNNSPSAITSPTIGTFDANGYDSLHMSNGVILCTGNVDCAPGFTMDDTTRTTAGMNTYYVDQQLLPIYRYGSCSTLDFDFVCAGDSFSFSFVFASLLYPDWTCSYLDDIFAAFVSGPDPDTRALRTRNIACIPGTVDDNFPDGIAVSVNTVNNGYQGSGPAFFSEFGENCRFDFTEYFRENYLHWGIIFGGYTVKFSVGQRVVPFQTYHMHLTLGGNGGGLWNNSAVFLEGNSLHSSMTYLGLGASDTLVVMGQCGEAVPLSLSQTPSFDEGTVHFAFGGTAVYGRDYEVVDDHGRDLSGTDFYIDNSNRYFTIRALPGADLSVYRDVEVYLLTQLNAEFPLTTRDTMHFILEQGSGVEVADTTITCSQACFEVSAPLVSGDEPITYRWEPATGLADPYSLTTAAAIFESTDYMLIATGGTGCNSDTAQVHVVITNTTPAPPVGIDEWKDESGKCKVWPNPAQEVIHVEGEGLRRVELYSLDGKMVGSAAGSGQVDLSTAGLANGTYGLRIVTADGMTASKIVVNK